MKLTVCKKGPYLELFGSVFSRIRSKYGEIQRISPYSVRMLENADQNSSTYGHFSGRLIVSEVLGWICESSGVFSVTVTIVKSLALSSAIKTFSTLK